MTAYVEECRREWKRLVSSLVVRQGGSTVVVHVASLTADWMVE